MKEYRAAGATEITFGGGEPTIYRDFLQLVAAAREMGYEFIEVKSNGLRFCYPEFAVECIEAGIDRFTISVWGHTPEIHDMLAGRKGAFEMTEMGIKHLVHYGADVEIDFLLSSHSCEGAAAALGRFAEIGVNKFSLWLFSIFGSGGRNRDLTPGIARAGRAVLDTVDLPVMSSARVRTSHIPPCCLEGRESLVFSVRKYDLLIVTPGGHAFKAEESPFEACRHIPVCSRCSLKTKCPGPRIEYVEEFGDSEFYPVDL